MVTPSDQMGEAMTMTSEQVTGDRVSAGGLAGVLLRLIDRFARAVLNAEPQAESGWSVHTGESKSAAAGNEWIRNVNVRDLLASPAAKAAFQARIDVDRDHSIPANERTRVLLDLYRNRRAELESRAVDPRR